MPSEIWSPNHRSRQEKRDEDVWVIQAKWAHEPDEWEPCAFGLFFTRSRARGFIKESLSGEANDALRYRVVRYSPATD